MLLDISTRLKRAAAKLPSRPSEGAKIEKHLKNLSFKQQILSFEKSATTNIAYFPTLYKIS
jgi:hypothetical protein